MGRNALGPIVYSASKVLAERAAWDFMEKHKESIKFDMVAINPSFVSSSISFGFVRSIVQRFGVHLSKKSEM